MTTTQCDEALLKKWCPSSLLLVDNYLISTVKIVLEEDNIKTTAVRSLTYNSVLCVKDERASDRDLSSD